MRRAATLAVILLAAGCVAPGAQDVLDADVLPVDDKWAVRALPHGDDHDHFDVTQHQGLSTPNFQLLGWDPLVTDAKGASAAGYLCGETATTPDGRQLAVVNSFVTDVVFVVVDVTDPNAPEKVGEFVLENGHSYDVALTADGQHVIVGQDRNRVPVETPIALASPDKLFATWRSPCAPGGEVKVALPSQAALFPGTLMVGIQDPAAPVIEDFVPTPILGPHSVSTSKVDDRQFVVSSVVNLVHQASYFQFYEVVGDKLEVLSTWQSPPQPGRAPPLLNGHVDGTIAKHPGTEKTYAYLADWNDGLVILDFSNPNLPVPVGRWSQPVDPTDFNDPNGSIHGVLPLPDLWDGKHYVLAGQELGGKPKDRPTGYVFILDDTDPANPTLVGKWTLPVDVDWKAFLQFSTHYFAVVDKVLFVSTYHGGVWAADLSGSLENPPSIGVFLPDKASPMPSDAQNAALSGSPEVLDVLPLPNGDLLVYEGQSGAYVVRFDKSVPVPVPAPRET